MIRIITVIFLIILLLIGLSFSSLNSNPTELNYYFGSSERPLAIFLVIAFAIGALAGLLGGLSLAFKLKREIMKLKKAVRSNERELSQLRVLPEKK